MPFALGGQTQRAARRDEIGFEIPKSPPPRGSRRELNNFDRGGRVCRARAHTRENKVEYGNPLKNLSDEQLEAMVSVR